MGFLVEHEQFRYQFHSIYESFLKRTTKINFEGDWIILFRFLVIKIIIICKHIHLLYVTLLKINK